MDEMDDDLDGDLDGDMDHGLLEAHVALRLATAARHEAFVGDPIRAPRDVRARLGPLHAEGTVRAEVRDGSLVAVLAWRHDPDPWYGAPVSSVALDYDPTLDGIEEWLERVLDEELPRMEADLDLLLDARHDAAYRALRARGVGVDSIILLGRPEEALARLDADAARPMDEGVSLVPLDLVPVDLVPLDEEHVTPLIALQRETFTREPEFCWFGATERHLAEARDRLFQAMVSEDPLLSVVLAGGAPRGLVSASLGDDPLWGLTGGMSLLLAPELRGRGLARPIYRSLLGRMVERGARTFKGGTSQPGIIRLAALMGRPLQALVMRRGARFPERHFHPYL